MDDILIVDYDPRWPELFRQEAEQIRRVLGEERVVAIEHFGSTAVPGLAAKPIVDILIGVHSLAEVRCAIPVLAELGYAFWYENPDKDRMFFVKGLPPNGPRTDHLHVVEADSPLWERLLFRDYLRAHPDEAQRYAALKRDLAVRFPNDRERYTDAKTDYIAGVTAKARQEKTTASDGPPRAYQPPAHENLPAIGSTTV